jgi:molybdenum cofactor cytidylyltransferase
VVVGAEHDAVAATVSDQPCRLLENPDWAQGLASSLRSAAPHLAGHDTPVLVLACDQPALEAHHLHALVAGARQSKSRCGATRHGAALGVPAVVPSHWFAQLPHADRDRGFGAKLAEQAPSGIFILDDAALRLDIDTAEDAQRAHRKGWLDEGLCG